MYPWKPMVAYFLKWHGIRKIKWVIGFHFTPSRLLWKIWLVEMLIRNKDEDEGNGKNISAYTRVNVNETKERDLLRNINLTGLSFTRGGVFIFYFLWVALFRQLWNQYWILSSDFNENTT